MKIGGLWHCSCCINIPYADFLINSLFFPSEMNLWQKSSHNVAQNNFLSNFAPQMVGMWSAQQTPKVEQTTFLPNHHYEPGA